MYNYLNIVKLIKKQQVIYGIIIENLWNYYRDEPSNPLSSDSESFKYKTIITWNTYNIDEKIIDDDVMKLAILNMMQIKLVIKKLKLLFH